MVQSLGLSDVGSVMQGWRSSFQDVGVLKQYSSLASTGMNDQDKGQTGNSATWTPKVRRVTASWAVSRCLGPLFCILLGFRYILWVHPLTCEIHPNRYQRPIMRCPKPQNGLLLGNLN